MAKTREEAHADARGGAPADARGAPIPEGLTFDDVLLVPAASDVLPRLSRSTTTERVKRKLPFGKYTVPTPAFMADSMALVSSAWPSPTAPKSLTLRAPVASSMAPGQSGLGTGWAASPAERNKAATTNLAHDITAPVLLPHQNRANTQTFG